MTREELFKLWKKRHEKYLQKARKTLETFEKIKLGINTKMHESLKHKLYLILGAKCQSITTIRKTNWTQNGLDQQKLSKQILPIILLNSLTVEKVKYTVID